MRQILRLTPLSRNKFTASQRLRPLWDASCNYTGTLVALLPSARHDAARPAFPVAHHKCAQCSKVLHITGEGVGSPEGVVVDDNDAGTVTADGGAKHLGGAYHAGVHRALIDRVLRDDVILRVQAQHAQLLLRLETKVEGQYACARTS
jgi:hypothetical protein